MENNVASFPADAFLPVTRDEMDALGWDRPDIILVTGDAYVDHPSFGVAVMARVAEYEGMRVAILPQPNWRDDLRDFKKLGEPRYFFGVSAGAMDSMINHYTALKRPRTDDAYTPGGRSGYRPDMASLVYTRILKQIYPHVPVVLGGVEASMRRFAHYDYWQDKVLPSLLISSGADLLMYGMAERSFVQLIRLLQKGVPFDSLHNLPQTAYVAESMNGIRSMKQVEDVLLPSHEQVVKDKRAFSEAFRLMEEAGNRWTSDRLLQPHGDGVVVVNPTLPPTSEKEMDAVYDLPYTRLPHLKYAKKPAIPAFEMIRFSVTLHRGCFGGCSFCAISAHQGKFISGRSVQSVLRELEHIVKMPGFKGHVSDLGGPSANMYAMGGLNLEECRKCRRPSCIFPSICSNLNYDHHPLMHVYDLALGVEGVKKVTIGSGVRYDMLMARDAALERRYGLKEYTRKLITRHVSGRLKVAPEHGVPAVLKRMRKPPFKTFVHFHNTFHSMCRQEGLPWQLVPYLISGHPGCSDEDMKALSGMLAPMQLHVEPVQEFTPTPMTLSTTIYYTGLDPYTGEKVFSARSDREKRQQKAFFFGRKPGRDPAGKNRHFPDGRGKR